MDYFVNKTYEMPSLSGTYNCYYVYNASNNRLYHKKRAYIEEVTGSEKRRALNGYKKYLKPDECNDPEFYIRLDRAWLKSSIEENAVKICFTSDPLFFKKAMSSLESAETFVCDGLNSIDEKLTKYLVAQQEYGTLLIEALKSQWTAQYVNDNISNDDECLKTAFAVDTKHFMLDKLFDNDEDELISWLKKIILKRNEDIVYLTNFDPQSHQVSYYVYDKANDRLYQKGLNDREVVSLAKINVLNESLSVVDKSNCEDPEFYKRVRRFSVYASEEKKDVFLEFSDENGAKKFDRSFSSLQLLRDFLEREVKSFGVSVANQLATVPLLFALMYRSASKFYWYISKEKIYNEDGLYSDFADSAIKLIMARFSLNIEDFTKIFREIFSKLRKEEENVRKVSE